MVYAEILAGGIGSRMGNQELPKQFIEIKGKPIIIYTIENIINNKNIDKIIVCCDKIYHNLMITLINKYFPDCNKIDITISGKDRNETVINGCEFIKNKYGINDEDRIVTIDSVRIFISDRIINKNIAMSKKHDAVGTFFPVVNTIVEMEDDTKVKNIPIRKNLYEAHTPQTFNIKKLIQYYYNLDDDTKKNLTETSKIFLLNNEDVYMVRSDYENIKITYKHDIDIAENMIRNKVNKLENK